MNRVFFLIPLLFCLFFAINTYGNVTQKTQYYDKADVRNRNYGSNFKDYALIICLRKIDKKLNKPINKDLQGTSMALWEMWFDYDLEKNIENGNYISHEIDRLSEKYINNAGGLKDKPKATIYTFGCLNFYHSDDLDKLMKSFVIHPNKTDRIMYPNQ